MIQRIQTVYLFLAVLLNGLFFITPLFSSVLADPGDWLLPVMAASIGFSVILSLITIFMYNKRPVQIKWCTYAMLFQVVAIGSATGAMLSIHEAFTGDPIEFAGLAVLFLAWVFQFLAVRGIKKDEKLIKSMDRIR